MINLTTNLLAILFLHDPAFHSFGAAVAAIVGTPFIVVVIIAIAVSLVLRRPAPNLVVRVVNTHALENQIIIKKQQTKQITNKK